MRDIDLDILLELNGTEYREANGYWYKIDVWKVDPTQEIPHGIRYNLTLHDNYNQRIMGFDNAHAVKTNKKGYKGRIVQYDHIHQSTNNAGQPYVFISAEQLLQDFLNQVNQIMDALKKE